MMAIRPKTLNAAFVPVVVGAALVHHEGYKIHNWILIFTALSALLIQIATNLLNDAIDFKKGADTEHRIGPVRVTQSGRLSSHHVMVAGFACLGGALLLGIPLLWQ